MPTSEKKDSALAEQRLADLSLRHHHTDEALRLARSELDRLQTAALVDDQQMRNWLGKVQWLQGRRADLQEAMDRLADGVCA